MNKLTKSPIIYVLAQVRIGAILQMADYIPQIQERLRKEGYPLYQEGEIQEIRFGPGRPDLARARRWLFDNIEHNAGFLIQTGSIVFRTTAYDTSEVFFAQLQRGLEIIHEVVDIAVVERLGLRYIDAFQADPGHRLTEYFRPEISGISLEEIGVVQQPELLINLVADTQVGGKLVIRLSQNTGGWFLPPDLQPPDLVVKLRLIPDGEIAVLDYDHFIEETRPFSLGDIHQAFVDLHTVTSGAFCRTVSEFALDTWK